MTAAVPNSRIPATKEEALSRVALLEEEVEEARGQMRQLYSALLLNDLNAKLEDGTPVLNLAFAHDPNLRDGLALVLTGE